MTMHSLKDKAGDWVKTLGAGNKDTFDHLKEATTNVFGDIKIYLI